MNAVLPTLDPDRAGGRAAGWLAAVFLLIALAVNVVTFALIGIHRY